MPESLAKRIHAIYVLMGFESGEDFYAFWEARNTRSGRYVQPDKAELALRRALIDRAASGEAINVRAELDKP